MKIDDALVEAVTKELLRRLQAGNLNVPGKQSLFILGQSCLSDGALKALEDEYTVRRYEPGADIPDGSCLLVCGVNKAAAKQIAEKAASKEPCCVQAPCGESNLGVPKSKEVFLPRRGKRVISEGDIIKACPISSGLGQSIEIGANDILTPLASDYAAKMQIKVTRV
jgi:hypothetical protein